jgi:hypothetical protein
MNYSISVPFSAIQTALNYGANVTSTSTSVVLPDGSTVTSSYGVTPPVIDYAAQTANAAFAAANSIQLSYSVDGYARLIANSAVANNASLVTYSNQANASIALLQSYSNQANANIISLQIYSSAAFAAANNVFPQVQPAFNTANNASANTILLQGGLSGANANISLLQAYSNQANANITSLFAIDNYQNTITQSVYTQANTAARYVSSATAPSSPRVNDMWYDTDNDVLLRYTNDGTSNNWIDITGPIFRSTFIRPTYLISANVS